MKLFVFGSTGDLFKRKVLNALSKIENLEVFALGRKKFSDKEYLEDSCPMCGESFKLKIEYLRIENLESKINCQGCEERFSKKEINHFYIALPPGNIIEALKYVNMVKEKGYGVKVLVEKPFGASLSEAERIKEYIEAEKLKEDIFLADHYLFKENVLHLEKKDYKKIEIVSREELGVEGRIFYDSVGAINDMVQSHLLNVLSKVIGEEYLEELIIINVEVRQYNNYREEIGKNSKTETRAKILFYMRDKEILIETGKKFDHKENYLVLDTEKINLEKGRDPYLEMFEQFFNNKKENFTTIEQAIFNWKLVEKIKQFDTELKYY